jgi:hypothetical protein
MHREFTIRQTLNLTVLLRYINNLTDTSTVKLSSYLETLYRQSNCAALKQFIEFTYTLMGKKILQKICLHIDKQHTTLSYKIKCSLVSDFAPVGEFHYSYIHVYPYRLRLPFIGSIPTAFYIGGFIHFFTPLVVYH